MILKVHISLFLLCFTCELSRSQPVGIEDLFDLSQNEQLIISRLVKRLADDNAETQPTRQIRRGNSHFSNHPPLEENQNIPVVVVYDDVKAVQPRRSKSSVKFTTPNTDSVTQSTTSIKSTISKEEATTAENIAKTNSKNTLPQIDVTVNTENTKESKIEVPKEDTTTSGKITKTTNEKQLIKPQSTAVPRHVQQKQIPVTVVQDINENSNKITVKTSFVANTSNNTLPQIEDNVNTENREDSNVELKSSNEASKNKETINKKSKVTATNTAKITSNVKTTEHSDSDINEKNNENDHKNIEETTLESSTRKSKYIRQKDPIVPIVESTNFLFAHSGKFEYSYEGGDGTKAFESGKLKEFDDDRTGEAVIGGFSYKDKEGNDFAISYTADENGYRPVGAHLPTPPPIPPEIARALAYLATKTTPVPATESFKETEATTVSGKNEAEI